MTLVQNPLGIWELLLKANDVGPWSMFDLTFSSIAMRAVWAAEVDLKKLAAKLDAMAK